MDRNAPVRTDQSKASIQQHRCLSPKKGKEREKKKNQMSHIRTDDLINICVTGRVRHNKNWKQDASCSLKKRA
jgi:hypothetical protein